jgi:hypothetical protein
MTNPADDMVADMERMCAQADEDLSAAVGSLRAEIDKACAMMAKARKREERLVTTIELALATLDDATQPIEKRLADASGFLRTVDLPT